jgi:hypothetical protein
MPTGPELRIDDVQQIFNDGNHNAFTDLCRFRGRYYVTFRSCPDGHSVTSTARVVILTSDDTRSWEQMHEFSVPDRDTRDPHFLIFGDKLFVYTGTWLCDPSEPGRDLNRHLGYAAWTEDGQSWLGPRFLEGTYGHYIWRAATYGDTAYLCGRRLRAFAHGQEARENRELLEGAMLESDDGLIWRTRALFTEDHGNETAFLFEPDGAILALARGGPPQTRVCRSRPPYTEWTRTELDRNIGGPMLERWGEHYLVGGRKYGGPDGAKTVLWWLIDDQLQEAAELPSGGDNSYPGFVPLSDTEGLLSYYSSHEGSGTSEAPSAIYLARLSVD